MPEPQAGERPRVNLTIASDSLAWMHSRTAAGDPFTSESHAAELGAARLRAEQAFVRDKCRAEGVAFELAAFWQLYAPLVEKSKPDRRGRRPRGVAPERRRQRIIVGLETSLLRFLDANCEPKGPFASTSHAIETAWRHLEALEAAEPRMPGAAFPFNGGGWWRRYLRALKALQASGSPARVARAG